MIRLSPDPLYLPVLKDGVSREIMMNYDFSAKILNQPAADDIKFARMVSLLTQRAAAELVHRKDSARWREWESGRHPIDMAVWELFLVKAGLRS